MSSRGLVPEVLGMKPEGLRADINRLCFLLCLSKHDTRHDSPNRQKYVLLLKIAECVEVPAPNSKTSEKKSAKHKAPKPSKQQIRLIPSCSPSLGITTSRFRV